ncbi:MAG: putative 2-aminoethylphosphonate ABC transporter ATP-binding protein [Alphaproteobacteria bacterium]|nr:putative 2-aminoethylphosphonate ABC transporter ATP-binding protein [Alphaproteobacteria bacterium]
MTTSPDAYLRIEGLNKRFGHFTALHRIDLEIRAREFVCFLGPSGCGKTTLLRAIAGLDPQTEGRIWQSGREISNLPPAERDFGIVFQSYALFPNLTVRANVGYGLRSRGQDRARIDARVDELLALVGLPESASKYPSQLSGGQQQRVALARALATSPGLLLLDEPLSALDARVRARLRHEVRELQRRLGLTTIMVTHDQEEALTMADRIVVMNHGRIEQIGTPAEIYRTPASPFVADFVGQMNFFDGQIAAPGRARVGALDLACDTDGLAAGAAVKLCLRPEDVRVRGVTPATANAIEVAIEEIEFLGAFGRATLRPTVDPSIGLVGDFSANLVQDHGLEAGQRVVVALPPERLRLFAAG